MDPVWRCSPHVASVAKCHGDYNHGPLYTANLVNDSVLKAKTANLVNEFVVKATAR